MNLQQEILAYLATVPNANITQISANVSQSNPVIFSNTLRELRLSGQVNAVVTTGEDGRAMMLYSRA